MFFGTKVEILIDTTIAASYTLAIYNNDPMFTNAPKAVLKSASDTDYRYRLGGQEWVDFSSRVKSINIQRGKSRFEDRMGISTASIVFNNQDGYFNRMTGDWSNPYALEFVPKRQVRISKYRLADPATIYPIFTGKTVAWNNNYNGRLDDTTTLTINDALNDLGNRLLPATTFSSQLSSDRVNAVLDLLGWPTADRVIDIGSITLQADSIADNTNSLDYLDVVTRTEGGFFYIDRYGRFVFRNRAAQDTPTFPPGTDPGSGYPQLNLDNVSNYTLRNGYDVLFNQYILDRAGGGTAVIDSNTPSEEYDWRWRTWIQIPGSQDRYGIISLKQSGLLFTSDAGLVDLGLKYADWLGSDVDRVDTATWLQSSQEFDVVPSWGDAYSAELGIPCYFAPPGIVVDTYNLVASIQHNITPESHTMTVGLLNAL